MLPDDNPTPFKKQRRRNAQSEWERVLQQRRNAIILRQQLPLKLSTAYQQGNSATPLDKNELTDEHFEKPALEDDNLLPTSYLRHASAQGNMQENNNLLCSDVDRPIGIVPSSKSAALTTTNAQGSAQNNKERREEPTSRNDVSGSRHKPENGSEHADERHAIADPCRSIFSDYDGEAVPCERGSIIRISAQRSKPNQRTTIRVYESGDHHYFDAIITAV